MGFHSNYICEKFGVKILHIFVQSGCDDEYYGPLMFEQRVGHVFEEYPTRSLIGDPPSLWVTD